MLFSGFSLAKLFGGFAIWQGEKLGKLLYILAIILICLGVFWKLFLAPSHSQHQRAENITNITQERPDTFIGIAVGRLKFGFSI